MQKCVLLVRLQEQGWETLGYTAKSVDSDQTFSKQNYSETSYYGKICLHIYS